MSPSRQETRTQFSEAPRLYMIGADMYTPFSSSAGPLQSVDEGRRSGWRCAMPATSTVPEEFALLLASFATITDPRLARGKVHPLPGVLALVVLGLMAGCRSLSAISRFGQIHP